MQSLTHTHENLSRLFKQIYLLSEEIPMTVMLILFITATSPILKRNVWLWLLTLLSVASGRNLFFSSVCQVLVSDKFYIIFIFIPTQACHLILLSNWHHYTAFFVLLGNTLLKGTHKEYPCVKMLLNICYHPCRSIINGLVLLCMKKYQIVKIVEHATVDRYVRYSITVRQPQHLFLLGVKAFSWTSFTPGCSWYHS